MDAILALLLVGVTALAAWLLAFGDPDRVGVAGTLLGGVVGFLAAWMLERSRRRYNDAHRFSDRRQALYTNVWIGCDRHRQQVANQVAWRANGKPGTKGPVVDPTEEIERACLAMDLIAAATVKAAAWALFRATAGLGTSFARADEDEELPGDADRWREAMTAWDALARSFLDLAQLDLREPG